MKTLKAYLGMAKCIRLRKLDFVSTKILTMLEQMRLLPRVSVVFSVHHLTTTFSDSNFSAFWADLFINFHHFLTNLLSQIGYVVCCQTFCLDRIQYLHDHIAAISKFPFVLVIEK